MKEWCVILDDGMYHTLFLVIHVVDLSEDSQKFNWTTVHSHHRGHQLLFQYSGKFLTSHMRVMNHNWSARKRRLQISVCKSPFPSTGTAVSLLHAKTDQ